LDSNGSTGKRGQVLSIYIWPTRRAVTPRPWRGSCDWNIRGKTAVEFSNGRKSADWKVAIAAALKLKTQASNRWLCEQLHMGTPVAVSHLVGLLRRQGGPVTTLLHELTEILKT